MSVCVFGRAWGMILHPWSTQNLGAAGVAITAPWEELSQSLGQVLVKRPKYEKFLEKFEDSVFSLGIIIIKINIKNKNYYYKDSSCATIFNYYCIMLIIHLYIFYASPSLLMLKKVRETVSGK